MEKLENGVVDDIIIQSENGIITTGDIEKSIEDYTNGLHDPESLYKPGHKSFNGLLLYLYNHNVKYVLPNTYKHNYDLLDDIFIYLYIPLVYRFNRIASISNYCILVQIDYSVFYDIKNGTYRNSNGIVTSKHTQIIKKWINICNGELIDNVVHTGNIGAMFLAKVHGFREDNTTTIEIKSDLPILSEKQLNAIASTVSNTPLELPE